ncbi:Os06g0337100, partial [Oryza sativa Japonica Group]
HVLRRRVIRLVHHRRRQVRWRRRGHRPLVVVFRAIRVVVRLVAINPREPDLGRLLLAVQLAVEHVRRHGRRGQRQRRRRRRGPLQQPAVEVAVAAARGAHERRRVGGFTADDGMNSSQPSSAVSAQARCVVLGALLVHRLSSAHRRLCSSQL